MRVEHSVDLTDLWPLVTEVVTPGHSRCHLSCLTEREVSQSLTQSQARLGHTTDWRLDRPCLPADNIKRITDAPAVPS